VPDDDLFIELFQLLEGGKGAAVVAVAPRLLDQLAASRCSELFSEQDRT
jgi:hypothetical protein